MPPKPYICKLCKKSKKLDCEHARKDNGDDSSQSEDEKQIAAENSQAEKTIPETNPDSQNPSPEKPPFTTLKDLCTPLWDNITQKLQDVSIFRDGPPKEQSSGASATTPSSGSWVVTSHPTTISASFETSTNSFASNFTPVEVGKPIDSQGSLETRQTSFQSGTSAFTPYTRSGDILRNILERPPLSEKSADFPVVPAIPKTVLDEGSGYPPADVVSNYFPSAVEDQSTHSKTYKDSSETNTSDLSSSQSGSSHFTPQTIPTGNILRSALLGAFSKPSVPPTDCLVGPNLNELPRNSTLEDGSRYLTATSGSNPPVEDHQPTIPKAFQGDSEIQSDTASGLSITSPQKRASGEILRNTLLGTLPVHNPPIDDPVVIKKPKTTLAVGDGGESSTSTLGSFHPSVEVGQPPFTENYEGDIQTNHPTFTGNYPGGVSTDQPAFTESYEGGIGTHHSDLAPLDLSQGIIANLPTVEGAGQSTFTDYSKEGIHTNQPSEDAPLDLSQKSNLDTSDPDLNVPSPANVCPLCDVGFETEADLEDHFNRMIHDETNFGRDHIAFYKEYRRPGFFKCPYCDMRFDSYFGCHEHKVDVHPMHQIECKFCSSVLGNAVLLKEHEVQMHKDILTHVCLVCGGMFVSDDQLNNHDCKPEISE